MKKSDTTNIELSIYERIYIMIMLKSYSPLTIIDEMLITNIKRTVCLLPDEIERYDFEDYSSWYNKEDTINVLLTKKELNLLSLILEQSEEITDELYELYLKLKQEQDGINS